MENIKIDNTNNNENINVNLEGRVTNDNSTKTVINLKIDKNTNYKSLLKFMNELDEFAIKHHVIFVKDSDKYGR